MSLFDLCRSLNLTEYFNGVFFLTTNSRSLSQIYRKSTLTKSGVGTVDEVKISSSGYHLALLTPIRLSNPACT